MEEEFLHHTWAHRLFEQRHLRTVEGLPVEVVHPGELHADAGPDFFNALLKIGGQLWAGNVEVHVRASDWTRHGHQYDAAYHSVILHVVHDYDAAVTRPGGTAIPALELGPHILPGAYARYLQLSSSTSRIPCANLLGPKDGPVIEAWMDTVLAARMEERTVHVERLLAHNRNDWEETCYQYLARGFGFRINAEPFEQLARSLPLKLINRHARLQAEALLFGQAGMLEARFRGGYPLKLQQEFRYLQHKLGLKRVLHAHSWKFLRMRPSNFPGVRLAQFAAFLAHHPRLLAELLEENKLTGLRALFEAAVSVYWEDHYTMGHRAARKIKHLGAGAVELLLINAVIPLVYAYGRIRGEKGYMHRALRFLAELGPEDNRVLREWKKWGVAPRCAGHSQALIHLKKKYCDKRKCLDCGIGRALLKNKTPVT
jgi:hypothetical protein